MATETSVLAALEKNPECYACGEGNAHGLKLRFVHTAPFTAEALTIAQPGHEGWAGILHGGVTFTMMDEAFGWCLYFEGIHAVTAKVETRFLKPVPTGTPLIVRAWVTADRRRLISASAEVVSDDDERAVFAEATATMMRVTTRTNGRSEQ